MDLNGKQFVVLLFKNYNRFCRRATVDPTQLCEEYMDPTIPIPVNPSKNWFLLQIKVLHLTPAEFSTNQNGKLFIAIFKKRFWVHSQFSRKCPH